MANKLATEKKVAVISLLAEGNSIRATARMTGTDKKTVLRLLAANSMLDKRNSY